MTLRAALLAAVCAPALLAAQSASSIRWVVGGEAAQPAEVTRDSSVHRTGRWSLRLRSESDPGGFTTIAGNVPANGYQGDSVRLTVHFRAANLRGRGGVVWIRADDAAGRSVGFGTTQDTPLTGTVDWTPVTVAIAVPTSAQQIVAGAFISGAGTLWIDDATITARDGSRAVSSGFEDADPVRPLAATRPSLNAFGPYAAPTRESPREAGRPLSARAVENVVAFTRAMGYVRFFHPADEALHVNWDEFAVRGIRAVESAPDANALASVLRAQFATIAPKVTFAVGTAGAPASPGSGTHVVFWVHRGIGTPSGGPVPVDENVYSSRRAAVPRTEIGKQLGDWPAVPDPDRPMIAKLEGGVTMTLPVALYTDRASLPDSSARASPSWPEERLGIADRATRLADVALAWSVLQHFYPYFDVAKTDWMATLRRSVAAAATDDEVAFPNTLRRLVADLRDGHGGVYPSPFNGMPDVRLDWIENNVVVVAAGPGAAEVHRGDVVTTVDGRPATQVLGERSQLVSGATPQWIRGVAVSSLLLGMRGTTVTVGLRDGAGARVVTLMRTGPAAPTVGRPAKIAEVAPGIMYVDLDRITDRDYEDAMPSLRAAKGIVFDMRGYPRQVNTARILAQLTDTVIHSAHFEVPMTTQPDRAAVRFADGAWTLAPGTPRLTARVAFLSGGGAISYAESTLGVVEAYRLGEIVGEASAGTNGNVNTIRLPGNLTIAWTGMRVTKRDGTPHHGVGVKPTVPVSPTIAGVRQGRDEVLERAVAVLGGRVVP